MRGVKKIKKIELPPYASYELKELLLKSHENSSHSK